MFNKNDPLIASVKKVMEQNEKERQAVAVVNEKFGIQNRKALPHQQQSAWEAEYKKVLSEETIDEAGGAAGGFVQHMQARANAPRPVAAPPPVAPSRGLPQTQAQAIKNAQSGNNHYNSRPQTTIAARPTVPTGGNSAGAAGARPPKPTPKPESQNMNKPVSAPVNNAQQQKVDMVKKHDAAKASDNDLSKATPDIKVGAARTTPKANVPFNKETPAKIDQDLTKKSSGQAQAAPAPAKAAPAPAKAAPAKAKPVVAKAKAQAPAAKASRPVAKVKTRSRLQSRTQRDGLAMDMREDSINEISSDLARRYIKKAKESESKARGDLYKHSWLDMKDKRNGEGLPDASAKAAHHDLKVANKRESGISLAKGKLTGDQHKKWEKPKGKRNITQVTKDTKVLTVKEENLDEVLDTPVKRLKYALKAAGSKVKARVTGDTKTADKRTSGLKMAGKKAHAAVEKSKQDTLNNDLARAELKKMAHKTGYGALYDKMGIYENEESVKQKKLQKILNRRFGKGDGKESVSQSRREDK